MVAPMKVSVPSSTYGRNVSCWPLLKRCTSSRNSTVRRPRSARVILRLLHGLADVLHARHDGRELQELGVSLPRDESRQRGLAGAGRTPEDQRVQLAAFQRLAQRLAGAEHLLLARRIRRDCAGACDPRAVATDRLAASRAAGPAASRASPRAHAADRRPNNPGQPLWPARSARASRAARPRQIARGIGRWHRARHPAGPRA